MSSYSESKSSTQDVKVFRFFNLPRELRDRVYRIALVTGLIDIDLVSCASDDDDEDMLNLHPDPKLRSTYTSLGKKMTYRLSKTKTRTCRCGACPQEPTPQLQLFYVSRTVYEESRDVFYKDNEFNTVLGSGLGCITFMKDRSYAVKMIRKLSFDIPLHTADFSYGRWADRHYKSLFKTIKEKASIRQLTLNFHGLVPDTNENNWRCPCDTGNWEHPLMALGAVMGITGVPSSRSKKLHDGEWKMLKALTTITDLPRLCINIDFCYHMLDFDAHDDEVFEHEHIRNFISYLRSRMLKRGDKLGTTQIHGYCRVQDEIEDKRYRFHSDDDEYGKSHLQVMKSGETHMTARHDHSDSGSELDDDSDIPDLEDMSESDAWESDNGLSDSEGDDGDESGMPPLEDSTDDELPHLHGEEVD